MSTAQNRRILLVDDLPSIHADFRKILAPAAATIDLDVEEQILFGNAGSTASAHFEIESAYQGTEALEKVRAALLNERPFAMAFVDMRMPPGWDGLETIEKLWAVDPDLQIVICSAYSDYPWTEMIDRLGHTDQLLILKKPFEAIEVLQCAGALTRKWQNKRMQRRQVQSLEKAVSLGTSGLEVATKQLQHLATHDALTGLPNRQFLEDRLAQTIIQAEREQRTFALVSVDLDRLKIVNNSLGHAAGDALLQEVARRLGAISRDVDALVRMASDKFMIIVNPIQAPEDGRHFAERVLETLEPEIRLLGVEIHSTASIGIAFFPSDGATVESLIARAGAAMHSAKEQGGNNAQCYRPSMEPRASDAAQLQSDLHAALVKGEFELFFQPKVDIASGAVNSAEALIRWRHPQRGLVSPAEFIPFAEACGLIRPIGDWVIREACRQTKAWQRAGLPSLRIAVNLAAPQFRHGRLLENITEALKDAQLDPTCLEVELTESAVMSDAEGSVKILEQLSIMGILVSLDDFGTGYSSMSYLRRFPIDKLKIDRSFISEITTRVDDASIVRAIVSLAHSLNLKVVAEGVETREQLQCLKAMRCDQYQGYYFSAPLPAAEFEALMRREQSASAPKTSQSEMMRTHSKLFAYRAR